MKFRLLDTLLCPRLGSKEFLRRGFSLFITSTALPCWWAPIRAKQLSAAATAAGYGYAHAWGTDPAVGWCMCAPCYEFALVCIIFTLIFAYAIELSSIYFSSIPVFQDISKKIQQRVRIGKIFARWHLAIATTNKCIYWGCVEMLSMWFSYNPYHCTS